MRGLIFVALFVTAVGLAGCHATTGTGGGPGPQGFKTGIEQEDRYVATPTTSLGAGVRHGGGAASVR